MKAKTMNLLIRFMLQPAVLSSLWTQTSHVISGKTAWVGVLEWPLWCLKLVKATIVLTLVDAFSNNLLSNCHMSRNVSEEAVRESQDPGRDVDHVSDETELPQQPSQTSGPETNVAPVSQPDVSMPDPGPPETPDETAETSDDDRENTAEPFPHSSSSHWPWRREYEVLPSEPGDSVVTRRRVVAKRPPTGGGGTNPTETIEIGTCARIVPTDWRNCQKTSSGNFKDVRY